MNQHEYDAQRHRNDAGNAEMGSTAQWDSYFKAQYSQTLADLEKSAQTGNTFNTSYDYTRPSNGGYSGYVGTGYGGGGVSLGTVILFLLTGFLSYLSFSYFNRPAAWLEQAIVDNYSIPPGLWTYKALSAKEKASFRESNLYDLKKFQPLLKEGASLERVFDDCRGRDISPCLGVNYNAFKKLEPFALNADTYWNDVCRTSYESIYHQDLAVKYRWSATMGAGKDHAILCTPLNKDDVAKSIAAAQLKHRMFAIASAALIFLFGMYVIYRRSKLK